MRKFLIALAAMLALSLPSHAQNPSHFVGMGMGFQSASNQQMSGWMNFCTKTTEKVYSCAATDMTGGVTSIRAGIETIIFHQGLLTVSAKGDAGVATSSTGGVGGSYGGGGSFLFDISKPTKITNLYLVGSVTLLKSNVIDQTAGKGPLSIFGSRGVFRFGFGRTF